MSTKESSKAIKRELFRLNLNETIIRIRNKWPSLTEKDGELASFIGVSPSNLSQWKSRNTFPYREMIMFGLKMDINLTWLLTGVKSIHETDLDPISQSMAAMVKIGEGDKLLAKAGVQDSLELISKVELDLGIFSVPKNAETRTKAIRYYRKLLDRKSVSQEMADELLEDFYTELGHEFK